MLKPPISHQNDPRFDHQYHFLFIQVIGKFTLLNKMKGEVTHIW